MNKHIRLFLVALYAILFFIIVALQESGFLFLSSKAYIGLALIALCFFGGGLIMSYIRRNDKKGEYNFVHRFFLAFAVAGIGIAIVKIFLADYAESTSIITVCIFLLLGMLTPFSSDKEKKKTR